MQLRRTKPHSLLALPALITLLVLCVIVAPSLKVFAAGTISGNVYNDINGNGSDSGAGEPGVGGVGVRIWNDVGNNNVIDVGTDTIVAGVTTNSSGDYSFASQADGNYLVEVYDPTSQLGVGVFTDSGNDGIIDTTISVSSVTGQSIGYRKTTNYNSAGAISSTVKIDENTTNGPGASSLDTLDQYGAAFENIGDLNGDGVQDIAVGAPQDEGTDLSSGAIYIHYMNTDGTIDSTVKIDENTANGPSASTLDAGDLYGVTIANIGDLNGDGVQDLAVGAQQDEGQHSASGAFYIHYMNTDGTIDSTVWIHENTPNGPGALGVSTNDQYGRSIANIGDLNGDGVQDLAVGAHTDEGTDLSSGAIYIHYMNTDGTIDSTVKIDENTANGPGAANLDAADTYGISVENIGDLNGDGVVDIAVGANGDEGTDLGSGAFYIHYMNTDGTIDSTVKIDENTANGPGAANLDAADQYGVSIANLGDLNGDGVQDLAVGAWTDEGTDLGSGVIYIHYMNTDGTIDSTDRISEDTTNGPGASSLDASDGYGFSIANIGDLNGDGVVDIGVGARADEGTDLGTGAAYIHYMTSGSPPSAELSAATAASSNETTANNFPKLLVNGVVTTTQTIDVDITGGTATGSGTDYTSTDPITVTIPIGSYDGTTGTAVTITVPTLVQDSIDEGADETILLGITNPSSTIAVGDASGNATTVSTHTYTVTDDDTAGITIGSTPDSTTSESGGTGNFRIQLDSQPTANVTIALQSSDTSECTVASSITITVANWNVPASNVVTATGVDDDVDDGEKACTISTRDITSSDTVYDALDSTGTTYDDVALTNTDDDTAGFTIEPNTDVVLSEGSTNTTAYSVVLDSQPTSNVVIDITESSGAVTLNTTSLTFTGSDWDEAQSVSITGTEDANATSETDQVVTFSINHSSSDNAFDALPDQTRNLDIGDNDTDTDGDGAINEIDTNDDNDNISDTVETAAPNTGDANNDGTPDSEQSNVASFEDPVSGEYAVLEVSDECSVSSVSIDQEPTTNKDTNFSYPTGLMDFTLDCGTPGVTATVTQYYYGASGNFTVRKYNPTNQTYQTIDTASISDQTIGGQSAKVATYQVKDGGPLDLDNTEDGNIHDPAGLATQSGSLASTGQNIHSVVYLATGLLITGYAIIVYIKGIKKHNV